MRPPRRLLHALALGWLTCLLAAGCSSSGSSADGRRDVYTAPDISCAQEEKSLDAKDTIERVGGLVDDDFVVKFAESTRLGVVALVDGDTAKAYRQLHDTYGVELVARQDKPKDDRRVSGFEQVRDLVDQACR